MPTALQVIYGRTILKDVKKEEKKTQKKKEKREKKTDNMYAVP